MYFLTLSICVVWSPSRLQSWLHLFHSLDDATPLDTSRHHQFAHFLFTTSEMSGSGWDGVGYRMRTLRVVGKRNKRCDFRKYPRWAQDRAQLCAYVYSNEYVHACSSKYVMTTCSSVCLYRGSSWLLIQDLADKLNLFVGPCALKC